MSTLFCNYCYEIKKPTIFFTHRDTTQKIDVSDIESADCMYMIIDDIKIEDLPFIDFLMGLCEKNDYSYFVIMGKHLCLDVAKSIDKLSSKRFSSALPKLVISLDLALENELFENAYVGTYVKEKEVLFAQPINAGMLKYIELKKIFHCADRLVEQIKKDPGNVLRQIHRSIIVNVDQIKCVETQKKVGFVLLFNDPTPKPLGIRFRRNISDLIKTIKDDLNE